MGFRPHFLLFDPTSCFLYEGLLTGSSGPFFFPNANWNVDFGDFGSLPIGYSMSLRSLPISAFSDLHCMSWMSDQASYILYPAVAINSEIWPSAGRNTGREMRLRWPVYRTPVGTVSGDYGPEQGARGNPKVSPHRALLRHI